MNDEAVYRTAPAKPGLLINDVVLLSVFTKGFSASPFGPGFHFLSFRRLLNPLWPKSELTSIYFLTKGIG